MCMKITWPLVLLLSASTTALAEQQPPWNPTQNTNSIPTTAIICGLDVLTANASSTYVHRRRPVSVAVTCVFALSWCHSNAPAAPLSGTLSYSIIVDAPLASTAAFHIYEPNGLPERRRKLTSLWLLPLTTLTTL